MRGTRCFGVLCYLAGSSLSGIVSQSVQPMIRHAHLGHPGGAGQERLFREFSGGEHSNAQGRDKMMASRVPHLSATRRGSRLVLPLVLSISRCHAPNGD